MKCENCISMDCCYWFSVNERVLGKTKALVKEVDCEMFKNKENWHYCKFKAGDNAFVVIWDCETRGYKVAKCKIKSVAFSKRAVQIKSYLAGSREKDLSLDNYFDTPEKAEKKAEELNEV